MTSGWWIANLTFFGLMMLGGIMYFVLRKRLRELKKEADEVIAMLEADRKRRKAEGEQHNG